MFQTITLRQWFSNISYKVPPSTTPRQHLLEVQIQIGVKPGLIMVKNRPKMEKAMSNSGVN